MSTSLARLDLSKKDLIALLEHCALKCTELDLECTELELEVQLI